MVKQRKESNNKSQDVTEGSTRIAASGAVKKRAAPRPKVQILVLPPLPCKSLMASRSSFAAAGSNSAAAGSNSTATGSNSVVATPISKCRGLSKSGPLPSEIPANATGSIINNIEGITSPLPSPNYNPRPNSSSPVPSVHVKKNNRSDVWIHFEKVVNSEGRETGRARCLWCHKDYQGSSEGGTSSLWKVNAIRYHILAKVARDVFAIQFSTVASKSAFSTGNSEVLLIPQLLRF